MSQDINLLPSQAKFQAKKIVLKSKINSFLWVFGGGWITLLIVVLGVFWISKLIVGQLDKKYQTSFNQYKNLLSSMVVNQQVKYQAKVVGQVLGERFEYGSSIDRVRSLFPESIKIEDVQIEDKEKIILKGTIVDGQQITELEQRIVSINNNEVEGFSRAILTNIQIRSGVWSFTMEVKLK